MDTKQALRAVELTDNRIATDKFHDVLTVAHIDAATTKSNLKGFIQKEIKEVNSFLMIYVQDGHAEVKLDYKTHRIASDKLTFIIPNHIFQIAEMSPNFKAKLLVVDKLFMEEAVQEKTGFYNYISLKRDPITHLEREDSVNLEKALLLLQEKIRLHSHAFQKEMVHNATAGLLLELLSIMVKKNNDLIHPVLSRKEEIVDEFLKLLPMYARERHPLSFYADKLFITPQYLSSTLKEQTGKTAGKWINEALIMEAKKLIKSPHATIQGVAYTLNFSDQSTFGKFFKKSIGISPLLYRRM